MSGPNRGRQSKERGKKEEFHLGNMIGCLESIWIKKGVTPELKIKRHTEVRRWKARGPVL